MPLKVDDMGIPVKGADGRFVLVGEDGSESPSIPMRR